MTLLKHFEVTTQDNGNIDKKSNKKKMEWELELLMIFSSGHFGGFDGDKIDDVIEMCVTSKQESGRHWM